MNYKAFRSHMINPFTKKNIMLSSIRPEVDERGLIEGTVLKGHDPHEKPHPAVDALVSLYQASQGQSDRPIYHTYTDEKGGFLFPAFDTGAPYYVKVFYHSATEDYTYMPHESKPFMVPKGGLFKINCLLQREVKRMIMGTVSDHHHGYRKNIPVELYLSIGVNQIPVVQLGKTYTDSTGSFHFHVTGDGNYCLKLYV